MELEHRGSLEPREVGGALGGVTGAGTDDKIAGVGVDKEECGE